MSQEFQPPYGQLPPPPHDAAGEQMGQHPSWPQSTGTPAVPQYYGYSPHAPQAPGASGMYVAAAAVNWVVLGLIVLGTCGFGIIAAAWYVPMTVYIHKGSRDRYKHTGLGVCTLLFCNIVSGILMLVEDSNRVQRPVA